MSLVTGFPSKTLRAAKASTDEAGSGGKLVPCVGIPAFIVREAKKMVSVVDRSCLCGK